MFDFLLSVLGLFVRAVKLIEEGSADADHLGMRRELDRFDPPAPPNERVFGSENGS
jgi:hypothetical protein